MQVGFQKRYFAEHFVMKPRLFLFLLDKPGAFNDIILYIKM